MSGKAKALLAVGPLRVTDEHGDRLVSIDLLSGATRWFNLDADRDGWADAPR